MFPGLQQLRSRVVRINFILLRMLYMILHIPYTHPGPSPFGHSQRNQSQRGDETSNSSTQRCLHSIGKQTEIRKKRRRQSTGSGKENASSVFFARSSVKERSRRQYGAACTKLMWPIDIFSVRGKSRRQQKPPWHPVAEKKKKNGVLQHPPI